MRPILLMMCGLLLALVAGTFVDEKEQCLRSMETVGRGVPAGDLDRFVQIIVGATEKGDLVVWHRLRAVVTNKEIKAPVRLAALRAAVQIADTEIAIELLDVGRRWIADLDTSAHPPRELATDDAAQAESMLLSALVRQGIPVLADVTTDSGILLDFVSQVAGNENLWISIEAREASYTSLATLPVSASQRRETIVSLLREKRGWQQVPRDILAVLDGPALSELYKLLEQSSLEPELFHWGAAVALAHHGHERARPLLQHALERYSSTQVNVWGMLQYYLWQIDVQNPTAELLNFIASPGDILTGEKRLWAVRRAVEVGLPEGKIRNAILENAQRTPVDRNGIRPGLSSLKSLAMRLGILEDEDLPDVKTMTLEP